MSSPNKPWQNNANAPLQSNTSPDISQQTLLNEKSGIEQHPNTAPQVQPTYNATNTLHTDYPSHSQQYNMGLDSMYGGSYGGNPYNSYGQSGYGQSFGMGYGGYQPSMGYNPYSSSMYMPPYNNQMMYGQPMSFMSQMQMNTQPAFQLIERFVNTFMGFSQMLSSTYFATYQSFNAMVGVADQMAQLKNYMRNLFGIRAYLRAIVRYVNRLLGRQTKVDRRDLTIEEFNKFAATNKVSFTPLVAFFVITFGLPYLIHRLLKRMYADQQYQHQGQTIINGGVSYNQNPMRINNHNVHNPTNFENIEFGKALHDFTPNNQSELMLKKGELVAILNKNDPNGNACDWWTGRSRDGRIGVFPNNYIQILDKLPKNESLDEKKEPVKQDNKNSLKTQ